jgi:Tfp pilus assembly protein PilV
MTREAMTNDGRATGRPEAGFSLIEVIIAIGVLAAVLLSIASMFILGGRQVKTGKTITEATTLVQDIMASYDQQSFVSLYTSLGAADTDTTRTVSTATTGSPIAAWQPQIDSKLAGGAATLTVDAVGNGTPNFGSAAGIKVTVAVTWSELGRPETVRLSTMRF